MTRKRLWTLAITISLILVTFPLWGPQVMMPLMSMMNPVPADLNTATTRPTDKGIYNVSFASAVDPIEINQIHSWTLHVETTDGMAVENAEITLDGGMPQHGHGLPTRPQVTENLGNGDYRVEGLKFQMPGWWVVRYEITADGQNDGVTFNLVLQ